MKKPAKKPANKNKKQSKKRLAIMVTVILLALLGGTGGYVYYEDTRPVIDDAYTDINVHNAQTDALFRKYLIKTISSSSFYAENNYADPTGSTSGPAMAGKTVYDSVAKTYADSYELSCKATIGDAQAELNVTAQTENADTYLRLNDASGTLTAADGRSVELGTVFNAVKGNWYKIAEQNEAMKSQIDSGVFVFPTGLIAPGHDAEKVADALINNRVYEYSFSERKGDTYVFHVTTHKTSYVAALKQAFPAMKSADVVVDTMFTGDSTETDSTLSIDRKGAFINQQSMQDDICPGLVTLFLGSDAQNVSALFNETITAKPVGSVQITHITDSKPITDISL